MKLPRTYVNMTPMQFKEHLDLCTIPYKTKNMFLEK